MKWDQPATAESAPTIGSKPAAKGAPTADGVFRDRIVEFARLDPGLIEPHPLNWRTHGDGQRSAFREIAESIGVAGACLVYHRPHHADGERPYRLIDGHLRTDELNQPVPCLVLDLDDDEAATLLATFDPLSSLAGIDQERLRQLLEDRFDDPAADGGLAELLNQQRLLAGLTSPKPDQGDVEHADQVGAELTATEALRDKLQAKWKTAPGQAWAIGPHRLFCGDCVEDLDRVRALMADAAGKSIDEALAGLVWTDPPYGVAYASRGNDVIGGDRCGTEIVGLFGAVLPAVLAPGRAFYVCGGAANVPLMFRLFDTTFQQMAHVIVWDKERLVLRRNDYHSEYELIFYGWRPVQRSATKRRKAAQQGKTVKTESVDRWFGDRKQTDLWRVPSVLGDDRKHINQKPLGLPLRAITNSSQPGDLVLDPFAGSGSALVAAEQLGRVGVGAELHPGNVAIALEWLQQTGAAKPKKLKA